MFPHQQFQSSHVFVSKLSKSHIFLVKPFLYSGFVFFQGCHSRTPNFHLNSYFMVIKYCGGCQLSLSAFSLSLSIKILISGLLVTPVAGGGCELGYVAHSDPKGQVSA